MSKTNGFADALKQNPESLSLFLKKMGEFDRAFCDLMVAGADFNIRLEIRGNQGEVTHCRVSTDSTDRPLNGKKVLDS